MFGRAAITLGIGPHSSLFLFCLRHYFCNFSVYKLIPRDLGRFKLFLL